MKNKLRKIIISLMLSITVALSLSGCVAIQGVVGSGETLVAPVISVDESKEIVYWEAVDGANRYNVTVNGNTETISATFYSYSKLSDGVYEVSVKALPSSSLDKPSDYSNKVSITVGGGTTVEGGNEEGNVEDVDYVELINGVTEEAMQANVTVFLYMKNMIGTSFVKESSVSQGSGVIYKKMTSGTSQNVKYVYRVLTNNHVIYKDTTNYNTFEYTVTDMYNNEYEATVVAYDANYDLAVVEFEVEEKDINGKINTQYTPLSFATANSQVNDNLISLGQPGGQKNAVTLGKIIGFATPKVTENSDANKSNVEFEVYRHTAPIKGGSSGGVVLDYDFNIIGINYASSTNSDGSYLSSFAIPVEKVKEFLLSKGKY